MEHPGLAIIIPSFYGGIFFLFVLYACIFYLVKPAEEENDAQGQPPEGVDVAQPPAQPGQPPEGGNDAQGQPLEEMNVAQPPVQPGQPPEGGNVAQPPAQSGQPPEGGNVAQPLAQPGQPLEGGNAAQPPAQPGQPTEGNATQHEPEIFFSMATVLFNLFQAFFIIPSIKFIPPVSKVLKSDSYLIFALPFTLLDGFFLLLIYKQRENITPRVVAVIEIGYVGEIIELGLWALGLYIQNIIDPECIICLFTLLNCSYFLISFVLFLRHPRALSFLDFSIGINGVILVYFIKLIDGGTKLKGYEYGLFSLSITTCVCVLLFKSHHDSVIAGIENPRTIFSILGKCIFTRIRRCLEYCWNRWILVKNWVTSNFPVAWNWVVTGCNACWPVALNWVVTKGNACWAAVGNWAVTQWNAIMEGVPQGADNA